MKLETENDDLVAFYRDAYGFVNSGPKYGDKTPMSLAGGDLAKLAGKYREGECWSYARALPKPVG